MSFRQFPATDASGKSYVVLEFTPEPPAEGSAAGLPEKRYELDSGEHLLREGNQFRTRDGALTLSM